MSFPGVATVIGAGSGIGQATAILFVKRGCSKIAIGDRNVDGLSETKKKILAVNGATEVLEASCDVTLEDSVNTFISKAVAKFGRIDYCCNVAGVLIPGASDTITSADWDMQMNINARGMWLCQKAELAQMVKQEPIECPDGASKARGAIANVASMCSLMCYDNLTSYCASKHAILGFTKADAYGYAKRLIRVNAVCPGVIKTPLLGNIDESEANNVDSLIKDMAMGRIGTPEEVAEGLLWLCSGRASFVTGIALPINGGMVGA